MTRFIRRYQEVLVWLAVIVATLPVCWSLMRPGYFPMHDDLQAFRIEELDKCLPDWQIPCRWVPDPGYQYGYPQFLFYPPSVYYLGEIWHLIGWQFIDSAKIMFGLGFVMSALGMYLLLKSWLGKWPAVVGALMYTYVPYKAVEVYVRGAMSEFWALVFFPLIFWSIRRLILKQQWRDVGLMSLTIAGLLLTHNLMALIFAPVAGIWALYWLWSEKAWKVLIKIGVAGVLGLGLAAFFTLPVLAEGKYVHLESLLGGYFDYRQHFVNISQLFVDTYWGYGSSVLGPNDGLSLSVGIAQWLIALIGIGLSVVNFKQHQKLAILTWVLVVSCLMAMFMIHQKSSFIWSHLPQLWYMQFPWRFLSITIFLLAILDAIAIYYVSLLKAKWIAGVVGVVAVGAAMVLTNGFFQPREWYDGMTDAQKFSGASWEKQLTISIFDYTPIYAVLPPPTKAPAVPELLDGQGVVESYTKRSDYQTGVIEAQTPLNVRLPLFDFPGMVVKVDGQVVDHWHNDCRMQQYCLGLISYHLEPGRHQVEARLTKTPIRWIGDVATLISLGVVVGLFWRRKKR